MLKKSKIIFTILSLVLTIALIIIALLFFQFSLLRCVFSIKDFFTSLGYYFCKVFFLPFEITPTITQQPIAPPPTPAPDLPPTFEEFKPQALIYFQTLFTYDNFMLYLYIIINFIGNVVPFLLMLMPIIVLLIVLARQNFNQSNTKHNIDTKPLKALKKIVQVTYVPIKHFIFLYVTFLRESLSYLIIWVISLLVMFNFATIILEVLAYLFYFIISFDLVSIYAFILRLVNDFSFSFSRLPLIIWLILLYILLDRWRKSQGKLRLLHNEMRNRSFIDSTPICLMIVGTMGKKKTTMLTDMALSQEVMLRDKAFEKLLENDLKFPYFPWINFEKEICRAMEYHEIYNLATCAKWINKKAQRWGNNQVKEKLFDYDYLKYGFTYDDNLSEVDVWDVLSIYCKLYFIYVIESSLLVSNYSIRVDNVLQHAGNFPLWNVDFFSRDSRLKESLSRHAHILDFDMLRLGKKIIENNPKENAFEFGVITITEVGKERGNMLDTRELKKNTEETNQKNDLFVDWLKLCRHSSTVDNFPFIKVLTDDQRPESLGADARELCQIIHIKESQKPRLALPFFFLESLLHDIVFLPFKNLYYSYRFNRGDNSLFLYLIKNATSRLHSYYVKIHNLYDYTTLLLENEDGTLDSQCVSSFYYLSHKKVYSSRFSTDCFSDYFMEKSLKSSYGIDDLPEYNETKAEFKELTSANSHFINNLIKQRQITFAALMERLEEDQKESERQKCLSYLNGINDVTSLEKLVKGYDFKQKLSLRMTEDQELRTLIENAIPSIKTVTARVETKQ